MQLIVYKCHCANDFVLLCTCEPDPGRPLQESERKVVYAPPPQTAGKLSRGQHRKQQKLHAVVVPPQNDGTSSRAMKNVRVDREDLTPSPPRNDNGIPGSHPFVSGVYWQNSPRQQRPDKQREHCETSHLPLTFARIVAPRDIY
jgi:hypothetical protein